MKKRFLEIIEKHNCKLITYENENNFNYRYVTIEINDENNQHLDMFDYEYHVAEGKEEIFEYFENWLKDQLA